MSDAISIADHASCQEIKIAVLGTGSIGTRHLEVLREIGAGQVIAVPRRPERLRQLECSGFETASTLAEARQQGANLCVIATGTGSHVDDGTAAMDQGFDVLVEKPMAVNSSAANRLWEASKHSGRHLFVGCVMRFSESLSTFRRLLPKAGRLHSVRIECQSYLPDWQPTQNYLESFRARRIEGGVLLDLIHEVDYGGWLFGWPSAVQGKVKNLGRLGIAADEMAQVSWENNDGCLVSVMIDFLTRTPTRRMRAFGDLGTIEWDGFGGNVTLYLEGTPPKLITSAQPRNDTFAAQALAFFNAVNGKHDPRLATAEEGVMALQICDAARRASDSGREEMVEL